MGFWVYVKDMDTGQRLNIHTDDCDFITVHKDKQTVFIIGDKKYIEQRGLESYAEDLECDLFRLTDLTHLVNLKKVAGFDEKKLELHFPDSKHTASVARIHKSSICQFIQRFLDRQVMFNKIEDQLPLWSKARKFLR